MRTRFLNTLTNGLTIVRRALDAGPGNTCGQPMSVAGHLVFAEFRDARATRSR